MSFREAVSAGSTKGKIVQDEVKEIFISSTVQDLRKYRRQVQDALLRRTRTAAFLSEDWVDDLQDVVALCRNRLSQANGYYGIFAHWYGTIPDAYTDSITCLEFRWARDRWPPGPKTRIALFLPERGSIADEELRAEADRLLAESCPEEACRALRLRKHKEFLDEAVAWQKANFFSDFAELREQAIVVVERWRGTLQNAAADAQAQSQPRRVCRAMPNSAGSAARNTWMPCGTSWPQSKARTPYRQWPYSLYQGQ